MKREQYWGQKWEKIEEKSNKKEKKQNIKGKKRA